MTLPTLTVVVPCYNGLPFVTQAVESVLLGADAGVKCVVVDDGSSDGSAAAVERLGLGARVVRQPNAGVGAARNRGAAEADTDLIAWLDADDYLAPGSAAARRRAFAADPGLDLLVGRNKILNVDTGEEIVNPSAVGPDYLAESILFRRDLPHSNCLTFRRSAVAKLGPYDPSLRSADDFDVWVRAWTLFRPRFLPEVLSVQRTGSYSSLTRRNGRLRNYWDVGRALLKNRARLRRHFLSDRPWRRGFAAWATDYALAHLNEGGRREAFLWAARAIAAGRGRADPRAYKYALEGLLPPAVYEAGRQVAGLGARP